MYRLRAALLLLAVSAAALVAPASAHAEGIGIVDHDVLALKATGTPYARTSGVSDVVSATVSATNQVVFSTSDSTTPTVTFSLGDGSLPQAGTLYRVNDGTTKNRLDGVCPASGSGRITVDSVTYSGQAITQLSATYGLWCTQIGWASGVIQIGVTNPYSAVRPDPVSVGRVPAGRQTVTPVRFVNNGTGPTGILQPTTVGTNVVGVTDFSIVTDGCGGRTLAPGDDCTVDVGFNRATSGTSVSMVTIPDPTSPGRQLVTGISATAVSPPSAPSSPMRVFPVRGGYGVAWGSAYSEVSSYRVLKAAATGWVDASGPLPSTARTWVDSSLASGASATYEVIATNLAGDGPASPQVTGTRPAVDATVGTVNALTLDLEPSDPTSGTGTVQHVGRDVVITKGFDPTSNDYETLTSSSVQASFPALLPGPGHYDATQVPERLDFLRVSDVYCGGAPSQLDVDAVSYTPAGVLESLTAHYRIDCGSSTAVGHINYNSPSDVPVVSVTPSTLLLPEGRVGETSAPAHLDVSNLGGLPVPLGARTITGSAAADWSIVSDSCGIELAVGATCSIEATVTPTHGGDRNVQLSFTDSTLRAAHSATLRMHAIGLPSEPTAVKAVRLPFGGVDLTWSDPADPGGLGATHWFVRRQVDGTETRFDVGQNLFWTDPNAPFGATYTVSMENTLGEGPQSAPVQPSDAVDVLAVKDQVQYGGPTPKLAGLAVAGGRQPVPWPVPGVPDQIVAAEASPNGRVIATVRWGANASYEIWRHPIDNSTAPVKMWSTPERVVDLAWSPDASRIAVWTSGTTNCCAPTTYVIDAATGKAVSSTAGVSGGAWLPDSRTLVATDESANQLLVKVDGATGLRLGPVTGSPRGLWPTVSPDGRWLTYNEAQHNNLLVVPLAGGTASEVPELYRAAAPLWAPDSTSFIVSGPPTLFGALNRVSISSVGVPTTTTPIGLVWGADPVPLTWAGRRVAIMAMPALTGPVATVPIDFSTFPTGTSLSCAVDSGAYTPCTTPWKTPALAGGDHALHVRTVEPDGRTTVAARTITVDAAAPVTTTTAMPQVLLATASTLRFSAIDTGGSGVATYDVRERYATPTGSFTAPIQPATWQGLTGTSLTLTMGKGYSYCFSTRARDSVGNVGAWSAETCTTVALDDRSMTGIGWTRGTSAPYYLGTYTTAAWSGRVLAASVRARQVGLVVTTCSTCGTVDVRLAGVYLGRKSLASSTTRLKQVLWLPLGPTRTGTLTLTPVGSKRVYVDGLVLLH